MKTKLTLTVRKRVIEKAKREAMKRGMSLSEMFEELFDSGRSRSIKTEYQRAAERLLQRLEKVRSIKSKDDKILIREHVKRKFA
jgi:hypothetical protein